MSFCDICRVSQIALHLASISKTNLCLGIVILKMKPSCLGTFWENYSIRVYIPLILEYPPSCGGWKQHSSGGKKKSLGSQKSYWGHCLLKPLAWSWCPKFQTNQDSAWPLVLFTWPWSECPNAPKTLKLKLCVKCYRGSLTSSWQNFVGVNFHFPLSNSCLFKTFDCKKVVYLS